MDERYRIGEVVKGMGVGQYTLKHYEREGLVVPVPREESGYRYYSYRDFGRLIFVRNLRALGFSLDAVAEYLDAAFEDKPDLLAQQMVANTGEIERLMTANEALRRQCRSVAHCFCARSCFHSPFPWGATGREPS